MKTTGVIILVAGLLLTIFTTFTYFTKEKIVDVGKIQITKDEPHNLGWSPLVGIAVMGIGGVVLWLSSKKS